MAAANSNIKVTRPINFTPNGHDVDITEKQASGRIGTNASE